MSSKRQAQYRVTSGLKKDSHLPISGSIKARGGIYEVLAHAEKLALEAGLLTTTDDYAVLLSSEFQQFFSQHKIAVGSTGNLGLSIGIMSARLGLHVTVHMSADARQWKKIDSVRTGGSHGIRAGLRRCRRTGAQGCGVRSRLLFIDDENSRTLFLGYSVAGLRLRSQLQAKGITVDASHPLFVYLPCGVGGGPGGVAFGLKLAFGDHVHCFLQSPRTRPACCWA
nr:D-serine ammonia-lyase [Pectobacterium sp. PL152]